jgi:site-specific recombinase XerD
MPTPPSHKGQTFAPEPLNPDEVRQLIDTASRRSSSGIRLRALIGVMYGAGLRLAEALALQPKDVDTTAGTVRVLRGKGSKSRLVGIDPRSCELLEAWTARRSTLGLTGRHPLFATYTTGQFGRPLSQVQVRTALARLGAKAGIEKRVHPHGLRHSLASDMAERGVSLLIIQKQLGHASLAATGTYIDHLKPTAVVDAMRAREW